MITQERVRELFWLNDKGELFWREAPGNGSQAGDIAGHLHFFRNTGERRWVIWSERKTYLRSRLVFLYVNGFLPKEIDHIDHDTLNDCPENLRPADRFSNNGNRLGQDRDLPKGVHLVTKAGKKNPYCAVIGVRGKQIHLGVFPSVDLAQAAYLNAAQQYFGAYACGESMKKVA